MKYLVFALVALVGVPLGTLLLQRWPRLQQGLISVLVFLTVNNQDINFVSREWYRGTSRGFSVSLLDLLALSGLLLIWQQRKNLRVEVLPAGSVLFALYFAGSALSLINAADVTFGAMELLKMLRMYLVFWVVYHLIRTPAQLRWFLASVSWTLLYVFITMLKQKYLEGLWQARATFPHQNSLVLYVNLYNCLFFSLVLNAGKLPWRESLQKLSLWAIGVMCTIFTFSRGGLIFLILGLAFVFASSFTPRQISGRKILILVLCLIAAAGVGVKAANTIVERFETAPEESMDVRKVLAIAALRMVEDKPLGVGINNWGIKINPPYPYGDHIPRADEHNQDPEAEEEKGGLVETVYLMIAAECGWHTLLFYLLWLLSFLGRSLRLAITAHDPWVRAFALGLSAGLLSIYLQSAFEWVLKQPNNFYQLVMVFALILSLERLEKARARQRAQRKKPAPVSGVRKVPQQATTSADSLQAALPLS